MFCGESGGIHITVSNKHPMTLVGQSLHHRSANAHGASSHNNHALLRVYISCHFSAP
jgi:hypothetical protein